MDLRLMLPSGADDGVSAVVRAQARRDPSDERVVAFEAVVLALYGLVLALAKHRDTGSRPREYQMFIV